MEKSIDLAKEFLGKIITPSAEELGLLVADNIKYYRFKNQVKILMKAKKYVEANNIKVKEIPIKILVPLLENASLEDNDDLQNKWASLLASMADSENNLQNQVFPYLLSQLSIQEYNELIAISEKEISFKLKMEELELLQEKDRFSLNHDTRELKNKVEDIQQGGFSLELKEYEIANLVRLGLIRQLPPKIYIEELKLNNEFDMSEGWQQLEADYDPDDYGFRITDLALRLLELCGK